MASLNFPYTNYSPKGKLKEKNKSNIAFQASMWIFCIFFFLIFSGAAHYSILVAFFSLLIAGVLFIAPLFGKSNLLPLRLVLASVSISLITTAFYAPISGFFMGLQGYAIPIITKIFLGIRSSYFSIWLLLAVLIVAFQKEEKHLKPIVLLLITCIALGLIIGKSGLEPKISYLLNSFIALFSFVILIPWISRQRLFLINYQNIIEKLGLVIICASILYYPLVIVFFDVFRPDLALSHQSASSFVADSITSGSPKQWNSLLFGFRLPRFVGTFPNPILFGYFCAIFSFGLFVRKSYFLSTLLLFIAVLTLSKGALLFLISCHVIFYLGKKNKSFILPVLLLLIIVELLLAYLLDGSNRVHLRGLLGGLKSVLDGGIASVATGFGIGSGGNLARGELSGGAFSAGWLASGSESGIGVLVYQLGFFGLLLFLYLIRIMYKTLVNGSDDFGTQESHKSLAVLALCTSWFSNMLLQEDLINVTVISIMAFGVLYLLSLNIEIKDSSDF